MSEQKQQKPGIYCIEGVPEHSEGEISARPMLEMLAQAHGIRFVHRIAVTEPEFFHHFIKWAEREDWDYPILYLWYHGYPEGISLNPEDPYHQTSIRFHDITDALRDCDKPLENCIIHFGACSTLGVENSDINQFLKDTYLTAISGYKNEVGWIDGAAMELLYLDCLYEIFGEDKRKTVLNPKIMRECRDKLKKKRSNKVLADHQNFEIRVRRSK